MKKSVLSLFFIFILILPFVFAEEQAQIYSGFDRFIDNAKLFFSFGDSKVSVALDIREKEVESAIQNMQEENLEEANKNLDNALEKLILVQEKVSSNFAGDVEKSVNEVVDKIEKENLTKTFDRYVLEEEKTQLVAELVVEVDGMEGQTLTREVVQSENENRRIVRITVQSENGEIEETEVEGEVNEDKAVWEIVGEIDEIENGINTIVVERTYAEGTSAGGESKWVIEGDEESMKTDEGLNNHVDNTIDAGPQGIVGNPGEDSSGDGVRNEIVEGDGGEGDYAEGTTAEGIDEEENNVDNDDDSDLDSDGENFSDEED